MRRFAFKLEKLLELRRYHEREWEIKLAEASSRCIELDSEIGDWRRRRGEESQLRLGTGEIDVSRFVARDDYLQLVDDRVRRLRLLLERAESEREAVQQSYLEASRRRKVLTKLRERRAGEYYAHARREEGKVLDEIGATLAIRRKLLSEETDV